MNNKKVSKLTNQDALEWIKELKTISAHEQKCINIIIESLEQDQETKEKMSEAKWEKWNDTINCSNCGFGYFPTKRSFFINRELQCEFSKFNYCPMCGSYMGSYDLSFTDEERLQIKYK